MNTTQEVNELLAAAGVPQHLIDKQSALFEKVDALDAPCKRLLAQLALQSSRNALTQGLNAPHPSMTEAYVRLADALLGLAGYVGESLRDEAGEHSTGDSRVTEVLDALRDLTEASALAGLGEDGAAEANARFEQLQAEAEATGQDIATLIAREISKAAQPSLPVAQAKTTAEDDGLSGLYL